MAIRLRPPGRLLLPLLCTAAFARAESEAPPLFKFGRHAQVGFLASNGSVVLPPRFDACSRRWTEGCLWVVASLRDDASGNFLDASGRWILPAPARPFADDLLRVPPEFVQGRAVVQTASGEFAVATREGFLVPGLEARQADAFPFEEHGRFGFQDAAGRVLLPPRYDAAKPFLLETAPVMDAGRWGLVDRAGRWRLPPEFTAIAAAEQAFWIAEQNGKLGLLRPDGSWVHEPAFHEFRHWGPGVVTMRQQDRWGLLDTRQGQILLPPRYDNVDLPGSRAAWARRDGQWGLLSHSNTLLQPFEFRAVFWLSSDAELWKTTRLGRQGVVDSDGSTLLDCEYSAIDRMTDRILAVRADSGTGLFDVEARQWVLSPRYGQAVCWPALAGISAAVESGGRWALLRLDDEKVLLPFEHDSLRPWQNLVLARQGERLALFDPHGNPVLPWTAGATELPDPGTGMTNGHGKVVARGQAGLIDANGILRIPCRFEEVGILSEGAAPARLDGQWGFVRPGGDWLIPPAYTAARAFSGGLAVVFQNGKAGAIDRQGVLRIPFAFADAGYALHGLLPAAREHEGRLLWGLLHADGSPALPFDCDAIEWFDFPPAGSRLHGRPGWREL